MSCRCENCRETNRIYMARRRRALKKARLCVVCGRKAVVKDGIAMTVCRKHREYYRLRQAS